MNRFDGASTNYQDHFLMNNVSTVRWTLVGLEFMHASQLAVVRVTSGPYCAPAMHISLQCWGIVLCKQMNKM